MKTGINQLWTNSDEFPLAELTVEVAVQTLWVEPVVKALQAAGGSPLIAGQIDEVISILRFGQPTLLILSEGFMDNDSGQNQLLEYIQRMPAGPRRELFVVWIGKNIKSGDRLSAFSHSVNLVLEPDKLTSMVDRIKKSWILWKEMYQVFVQTRLQINGF